MASQSEYYLVLAASRQLPPPRGNYHDNDFVSNLIQTVLDYQMHSDVLERAYRHFELHHWDRLRTQRELTVFLAQFPDTKAGNLAAALDLWGYRYWSRLAQLRRLVEYFASIGVTDQKNLRKWARSSQFEHDFKGRVKGLGFAVWKWLLMRVGVETVKPDLHIKAFLRSATGRDFDDREAVKVLERVASDCGKKAHELDWAIWEHQKSKQAH